MPISFGSKPREDDVLTLIAARNYARAIELLKARLRANGANASLRMQLADVLILAGKKTDAVGLLLPLADQYASEGFAARAVSVLKKVQRIDPGRRDVGERLARLIEEKQREAAGAIEPSAENGAALEIGLEIGAISVPVSVPLIEPEPVAVVVEPEPVVPLVELEAEPLPEAAEPDVEDYDLLYAGAAASDSSDAASTQAQPMTAAVADEAAPMSAGQFADELMSLVDSVFHECAPAAPAPAPAGPAAGSRIVVSPLFRDFSVDEMVAVIEGLKLHSVERGGVILREGQPGTSLYMLTSGHVRAFRRAASGRQVPVGDLHEGAFFGEISVLTGQPRSASVVALTRSELLELDRPTLDEITKTHPRVWDVLREFAGRRAAAN